MRILLPRALPPTAREVQAKQIPADHTPPLHMHYLTHSCVMSAMTNASIRNVSMLQALTYEENNYMYHVHVQVYVSPKYMYHADTLVHCIQ